MTSHAWHLVASPTWGARRHRVRPAPSVRLPSGRLARDLAALGLAGLVWLAALAFLALAVAGPAGGLARPAATPVAEARR